MKQKSTSLKKLLPTRSSHAAKRNVLIASCTMGVCTSCTWVQHDQSLPVANILSSQTEIAIHTIIHKT